MLLSGQTCTHAYHTHGYTYACKHKRTDRMEISWLRWLNRMHNSSIKLINKFHPTKSIAKKYMWWLIQTSSPLRPMLCRLDRWNLGLMSDSLSGIISSSSTSPWAHKHSKSEIQEPQLSPRNRAMRRVS